MRFIAVVTVLGLVALTQGQKAPKLSSAHKLGGGGGGQGGGGQSYSSPSHYAQSPYQGGGSYNSLGGKPVHAQVLSDSRDSNGNFQYAADNGLQQGETVDPDGTRRGFYSYPGADGKPITVKYTAGKNGFVAEGDHLPRQPQVAPHSEKDSGSGAYRGAGGQEYDDGQYRPGTYSSNSARGHAAPAQAYSSGGHAQSAHGHRAGPYSGPASQYTQAHTPAYRPAEQQPQYNAGARGSPAGFYGGQGQDFGPVNYGAPSHGTHAAAPQTQYNTHSLPAAAPQRYSGGNGGGQVHSANNPYQQSGPAGPYAGNFDLGNGGQFSINFNPGQSQEVPIGGDFGGHQQRY